MLLACDNFCRDACNCNIIRHIFCYNCAGCNNRIIPNMNIFYKTNTWANPYIITYNRRCSTIRSYIQELAYIYIIANHSVLT